MGGFLEAAGLCLVAAILILTLQKKAGEMAILLSILACCGMGILAVGFLKPVWELIDRLQQLGQLDGDMLKTVLKVVGVALTGEVASLICNDAGSSALGKMLQFLAGIVILWLSIPMLTALVELVEDILGNL